MGVELKKNVSEGKVTWKKRERKQNKTSNAKAITYSCVDECPASSGEKKKPN